MFELQIDTFNSGFTLHVTCQETHKCANKGSEEDCKLGNNAGVKLLKSALANVY